MSLEIPNRLLAAASIRGFLIVGQSGFIGDPGTSIEVTPDNIELVFKPDVAIVPDRLLVVLTLQNAGASNRFTGFGANSDRLTWLWTGSEGPNGDDFDLLVYQLPAESVG